MSSPMTELSSQVGGGLAESLRLDEGLARVSSRNLDSLVFFLL